MKIVDERTPEQKQTHTRLVCGTDSFMSGWGEARGGISYAVWACTDEHFRKVFDWVSSRKEMKRVREVSDPYRPKGRNSHCHIYVVEADHPAVR